MLKYNQGTLDRIATLLQEAGYLVRYERGTFQSGYCILEQKKVVVLNKFLQTEGKVHTLLDIVPLLQFNPDSLSPDSRTLYDQVMQRSIAAS